MQLFFQYFKFPPRRETSTRSRKWTQGRTLRKTHPGGDGYEGLLLSFTAGRGWNLTPKKNGSILAPFFGFSSLLLEEVRRGLWRARHGLFLISFIFELNRIFELLGGVVGLQWVVIFLQNHMDL